MTTPDRELLRELSALRELLEPAPDDSAPPPPQSAPATVAVAQPLLDLAQIFDDDDGFDAAAPAALPRFILQDAVAPARSGREALIDALVAEQLPRLEAALRERLEGLDDAALRAWAEATSTTTD